MFCVCLDVQVKCCCFPLENAESLSPLLTAWNPMEHDFFSDRNLYHVDDEDVGTMFLGYSKSINEVLVDVWHSGNIIHPVYFNRRNSNQSLQIFFQRSALLER